MSAIADKQVNDTVTALSTEYERAFAYGTKSGVGLGILAGRKLVIPSHCSYEDLARQIKEGNERQKYSKKKQNDEEEDDDVVDPSKIDMANPFGHIVIKMT